MRVNAFDKRDSWSVLTIAFLEAHALRRKGKEEVVWQSFRHYMFSFVSKLFTGGPLPMVRSDYSR